MLRLHPRALAARAAAARRCDGADARLVRWAHAVWCVCARVSACVCLRGVVGQGGQERLDYWEERAAAAMRVSRERRMPYICLGSLLPGGLGQGQGSSTPTGCAPGPQQPSTWRVVRVAHPLCSFHQCAGCWLLVGESKAAAVKRPYGCVAVPQPCLAVAVAVAVRTSACRAGSRQRGADHRGWPSACTTRDDILWSCLRPGPPNCYM